MFASGKTAAVASAANYIEEVFSTYLYTGNGSTQTITNGIDLSTKGGLVWLKGRSLGYNNGLFDTIRGADYLLCSNNTDPSTSISGIPANAWITGFNSDGFGLGSNGSANASGQTYASWTFREQPKFFDVVTYTGNGTNGRTVAHSLGSTPGCIIVKRTDAANGWAVYHRAMNASPQDYMMRLNATDGAFTTSPSRWNNTLPTSTEFTLSGNDEVNGSGATYVAYLFAHNAGGFGLSGADNVISCGSYTGNGSTTGPVIDLGYEPQWVMVKRATVSTGSWEMYDSMRGFTMTNDAVLRADTSGSEFSLQRINPTSTGFQLADSDGDVNANGSTYIYIAIRRGPMKVPTSGTSVFSPALTTDDSSLISAGFPVDSFIYGKRDVFLGYTEDRLRGSGQTLRTNATGAEVAQGVTNTFDNNTGVIPNLYGPTTSMIAWMFKRAPSFFDEVCYTGNGTYGGRNHNLTVTPELIITKKRSATSAWTTIFSALGSGYMYLNTTAASGGSWGTLGTSTVFYPSDDDSGSTYVAYLFATCAGVSKVGSYTGTGTTLQVNCGFTGGARFVLIKRTDSTGDWYVWDTARGIVSGNDPYLLLNSTAAETTGTDYIDTYSAGFEISSTAPAAINASGGSFIFLAIS